MGRSLCGGVLVIQPCCGKVDMQGGQNALSLKAVVLKNNKQAEPLSGQINHIENK